MTFCKGRAADDNPIPAIHIHVCPYGAVAMGQERAQMTPRELIDEIVNGEAYSPEDKEFATSVNAQLVTIGATKRQLGALQAIIDETQAALNGRTPYGPDHAYRVGL